MIEKNCRQTVRAGAMSVAEFSLVTAFERPRDRLFATGQGKRWSAIGNRAPVAAFAEDEDPRQNGQMCTINTQFLQILLYYITLVRRG